MYLARKLWHGRSSQLAILLVNLPGNWNSLFAWMFQVLMSLIFLAVVSLSSNAQMAVIVFILRKSAMHTVQRCILKVVANFIDLVVICSSLPLIFHLSQFCCDYNLSGKISY